MLKNFKPFNKRKSCNKDVRGDIDYFYDKLEQLGVKQVHISDIECTLILYKGVKSCAFYKDLYAYTCKVSFSNNNDFLEMLEIMDKTIEFVLSRHDKLEDKIIWIEPNTGVKTDNCRSWIEA